MFSAHSGRVDPVRVEKWGAMLQTMALLGLSDQDITIYRYLLSQPAITIPAISAVVRASDEQVLASCRRLTQRGLVAVGRDGLVRVVPAAVDDIAKRLVAEADVQHAQRLGQISSLRSELSRMATAQVSANTDSERIEVIRGAVAAQLKTAEVLQAARRQILIMQGTMRGTAWRRLWVESSAALTRGVEVRAICAPGSPTDADCAGAEVARARELGAHVRIAQDAQGSLVVVDRAIAVVRDLTSETPGIAIVRGTGVLLTLHTMFTGIWRASETRLPSDREGADDRPVDEREFQILRLLSLGMKDEAIANQVGLSVRTVRRTISTMMARLGVTSRFEMAALCVRKGWL
jgi:DNA-binding CsgD family transcriptional regulator/predicted DNA-binding transcriptional regulator